jgi:1-aminocyclopropane-1-carboxylate deaminase/D-cysteine desulfhydrase-like pyridoxal-dependent ACC family enzyme
MQLASNEEKVIRGRYCDEINYHYHCHDNDIISISNDKKNCQGGKRRRTHNRTSLSFAFHPLHHPRLSNRSIPKQIIRVVFFIAVFLFVERPLYPRKNAISRLFSPEMVLSLSITAVPQARSRTILQLFRSTKPTTRDTFRLSSDMDGFFEKGGDMDRLVEELSGQQPQNSTSSVSTIPDRNGWRDKLDLSVVEKRNENTSSPSPVEVLTIRGRRVYVKHDDQLRLSGSGISGNKARKMWTLNEIPAKDFPACLVSYGGPQSNSMLALAAVANFKNRELLGAGTSQDTRDDELLLENEGGEVGEDDSTTNNPELPVRFVYYTKKLPRFLRNQPNGNFFRAVSLGMELVEVSREEYGDLFEHRSDGSEGAGKPPMRLEAPCPDSLWVPQGGAFAPARAGNQQLAQEIYDYWLEDGKDRPLTVCVPGGTCTTALLLHHGLKQLLSQSDADDGKDDYDGIDCENNGDSSYPSSAKIMDIEVVVVPCVGDAAYARRQMMSLAAQIGASPDDIPTILQPEAEERQSTSPRTSVVGGTSSLERKKYFSFGKPNKTILDTFQELQDDCNLLLDLIYGAAAFAIMFRHWGKGGDKKTSFLSPDLSFDPNQPLAGREIMYVHSGGLEGINSQLLRYKYDGLVEIKDVQLPGRRNRGKPQKRTKKHQ